MESCRTLFDGMRIVRGFREGNETPWTLYNLKPGEKISRAGCCEARPAIIDGNIAAVSIVCMARGCTCTGTGHACPFLGKILIAAADIDDWQVCVR